MNAQLKQQLNERRLDTARHEAGHVLPFLLRGLPFKNVEILPDESARTLESPNLGFVLDGDDLVLGVMRLDRVAWWTQGCSMEPDDQIMQSLAGVAGEQIEYERPNWSDGDWRGRAKGDYQHAKEIATLCAKLWGCATRTYLKNSFKEAWRILRQHKAKHDALVTGLLEKSILTYAECVEIWNREVL